MPEGNIAPNFNSSRPTFAVLQKNIIEAPIALVNGGRKLVLRQSPNPWPARYA
jgi:hypothetical protein